MPCDQNARKSWWNVPDGSTLEVSLQSSDDEYTQELCWRVDAEEGSPCDEYWSREEVTPGPKVQSLEEPHWYDLDMLIEFQGTTPTIVDVTARIVGPDGAQHGSAYSAHHSGIHGDRCVSLLAILTRKS